MIHFNLWIITPPFLEISKQYIQRPFLEKGFWLLWPSYVYFWNVQGKTKTPLSCLVYRRDLQRLNASFSQVECWRFKENGAVLVPLSLQPGLNFQTTVPIFKSPRIQIYSRSVHKYTLLWINTVLLLYDLSNYIVRSNI